MAEEVYCKCGCDTFFVEKEDDIILICTECQGRMRTVVELETIG